MSAPVVELVSAWQPIGELRPTTLRYSEALNSVASGWTCTTKHTDATYRALLADGGSGSGIRVLDGARPYHGKLKRLETDGRTISLAGVPLLSMLADRVPIPEPGNVSGPWTTDASQIVSGEPVAAWTSFLDDHIGAGAASGRRLPKNCTVVGDGTSVGSLEFVARWSPDLLGLVEEHATASGVSIEAALVRNGAATDVDLVFTVRALRDNVGVVFDPETASVSWRVLHTPDIVTHAYAGGSGDGVARTQQVRSQSGPRRIERWVETSGDADAVNAAADAALVAGGSSTTLEVEITDTPGSRFGVDWLIGDLVTIRVAGVGQATDRITAVDSTLTETGQLVRTVRVGSGSFRLTSDDLQRRLGRLEGR